MTIISFKSLGAILTFSVLLVLAGNLSVAEAQTKKKNTARKTVPKARYYTVAAGKKVRVRMDDALNSETAHVGDTLKNVTVESVYLSGRIHLISVGA